MIVKHKEKGWEIISHYAHGLLSGKIAHYLKSELRPESWIDVITGIVEHDDHLLDFDEQEYLNENGTPKDFMMEGGTDKEALEHAKRVYENSLQKSQLVALMVGRHLAFLYSSLAKKYEPMKTFLTAIDSRRKEQRKLYGLNKAAENDLYDIMLFCDRLSLILCQQATPETGRDLEINKTINNEVYFISKDDKEIFQIRPWPFRVDEFCIRYEYRILEKITFEDNEDLKECLEKAPIALRECIIKK